MRHAVPFFVIALAAVAVASILLPSEPWTQSFVVRTIAILAVGAGCYLAGFATGKESSKTAAHPRRWLQFSLRTMLLVTALLPVWIGLYCNRARQQREAVKALYSLECIGEIHYDFGSTLFMYNMAPRSQFSKWLDDFFGVDFVHGATAVYVRASGAETALPYLKRLPYLRNAYVMLGDWPRNHKIEHEVGRKTLHVGLAKARLALRKTALNVARKEKDFIEEQKMSEKNQVLSIQRLRKELPSVNVNKDPPNFGWGSYIPG